ncbi:MAG: hypothetical protein ACYS7Y_13105, partial [Planctomycetota bacterium]
MKVVSMRTGLGLLVLSLVAVATTTAAEFTYPSDLSLDAVRERTDAVKIGHPRLLVTADGFLELRKSLRNDPLRRSLAEAVIKQADGLL